MWRCVNVEMWFWRCDVETWMCRCVDVKMWKCGNVEI